MEVTTGSQQAQGRLINRWGYMPALCGTLLWATLGCVGLVCVGLVCVGLGCDKQDAKQHASVGAGEVGPAEVKDARAERRLEEATSRRDRSRIKALAQPSGGDLQPMPPLPDVASSSHIEGSTQEPWSYDLLDEVEFLRLADKNRQEVRLAFRSPSDGENCRVTGLLWHVDRSEAVAQTCIADCDAFLDRAHRKLATSSRLGSQKIAVSGAMVSAASKPIRKASSCAEAANRNSMDPQGTGFKVLSLVDSVVSIEEQSWGIRYDEDHDTTAPWLWSEWYAVDLRTKKPAELTELVEQRDVLEGLRADPRFAPHIGDVETLKEAYRSLGWSEEQQQFAFDRWDAKSRRVGLRLAGRELPSVLNSVAQPLIWARPKKSRARQFRLAHEQGALMRRLDD